MLTLTIPEVELYDEENEQFVKTPRTVLKLEHSLVSVSKWESKYHKPLLNKDERSNEEMLDYIRMMTITQNVPDIVYTHGLTSKAIDKVNAYMTNPMTATTFASVDDDEQDWKPKKTPIITSEVIYGWMVAYRIAKDCERWHINRLLTLIRVCEVQNSPSKKVDPKKQSARNARLNAQRRAKYNTKG